MRYSKKWTNPVRLGNNNMFMNKSSFGDESQNTKTKIK